MTSLRDKWQSPPRFLGLAWGALTGQYIIRGKTIDDVAEADKSKTDAGEFQYPLPTFVYHVNLWGTADPSTLMTVPEWFNGMVPNQKGLAAAGRLIDPAGEQVYTRTVGTWTIAPKQV